MAYQVSAIPVSYIDTLDDSELEGSLEDLLQYRFGITITTSQSEISGDFGDQKISKLLEITTTTPCLVKENVEIDQKSRIIMWNRTWYNAERFKIKFDSACNVRETRNPAAS
jgi:DNA-binding GntR family transcriptional regulator